MRRPKLQPMRNTLDLTDRSQVRIVRKRLHLSEPELTAIVGRIGNSISAISKEAALQKADALTQAAEIPAAAVIASSAVNEQATTELAATAPAS
ncbi:DUF3606 domain-containing protein [Bradyrhizobium jicamae]|uniref:DUF3606 domain-containing protein n=1 Tax=Bradyrhizobium jicamae TaxID=280332 RepID=A0ABS5FAH9_9BRAD|nr:DUF3606 domain-containing protein [Bradyrhizobium jicamae]MBR0793793.1 DUF3606 domain-containing protein [Bradyrhizobium jicamae]